MRCCPDDDYLNLLYSQELIGIWKDTCDDAVQALHREAAQSSRPSDGFFEELAEIARSLMNWELDKPFAI